MDDEKLNAKDPFQEMPLLSYSLYTAVQADAVKRIGSEILDITNKWDKTITEFQRAYDLFWLWVLGSYEVIRTMDSFNSTFSESLKQDTLDIKILLAKIRMPFAKQQIRGKKTLVYAELSVVGFDKGMKFKINGETFNSTEVIVLVLEHLKNINIEDLGVEQIKVR